MDSNTVILAIDLGKFHSVFCWYDTASKQAEFRKVSTFHESFREILLGKACTKVVMVACSQAGWVSRAASDPLDPQECGGTDPGNEIPQRPESPSPQALWRKLGFFVFLLSLKSGGNESWVSVLLGRQFNAP